MQRCDADVTQVRVTRRALIANKKNAKRYQLGLDCASSCARGEISKHRWYLFVLFISFQLNVKETATFPLLECSSDRTHIQFRRN